MQKRAQSFLAAFCGVALAVGVIAADELPASGISPSAVLHTLSGGSSAKPAVTSTTRTSVLANPKSKPGFYDVGGRAKSMTTSVPTPVGALYQRSDTGVDGFVLVTRLASVPEVVALIHKHFPQEEWSRAERVASCESGMRASALSKPNKNGTRDIGVFQLNDGGTLQGLLRRSGQDENNTALALDAEWNVSAAVRLWDDRGWAPWACAAKLGIVAALWSNEPGPNW